MTVDTAVRETSVHTLPMPPVGAVPPAAAALGTMHVVAGPGAWTAYRLGPGAHVVGRGEGCELVLPDADVSRWHLLVSVPAPNRRGPGTVMIEDLGSRNGTFVDGMAVEGPTPLPDGSTVTLGRSRLVWNPVPVPAAPVAPAPVAPEATEEVPAIEVTEEVPVAHVAQVARVAQVAEVMPPPAPVPPRRRWPASKAPARPAARSIALSTATSLAGLMTLVVVGMLSGLPLLIPPLAASMALIAAGTALPLAQPRNVLGGQVVSALVGFAVLGVVAPGAWAAGLAGGLALAAMLLLRVSHSPAAATAVIVGATAPSAPRFLTLLVLAVGVLVAFGMAGARAEGKTYPVYWW
jgi:hypothetical protein